MTLISSSSQQVWVGLVVLFCIYFSLALAEGPGTSALSAVTVSMSSSPQIRALPTSDPTFQKRSKAKTSPKATPKSSARSSPQKATPSKSQSSTSKAKASSSTQKSTVSAKATSSARSSPSKSAPTTSHAITPGSKTSSSTHVSATSTSTSTTSKAGGCWQYDYSFVGATSDAGAVKRDDVDDDGHRFLRLRPRRPAAPKSKIGGCAIPAPFPTIPSYPEAGDVEKAAGAAYWYVPTTTKPEGHNCPVVTMTKYANLAALTAKPVITGRDGKADTYITVKGKSPWVNADHVYELSLMDTFIKHLVNSKEITCADFTSFFLAKDSSNGGKLRLQTILDALPGNEHPEFVGMDAMLNSIKGGMWNEKLGSLHKPENELKKAPHQAAANIAAAPENMLQLANQMAAIISLVNGDGAKFFKTTNSRIYNVWAGVDNLIAGGCGGPTPKGGWADAYKTWMTGFVAAQNKEINSKFDTLLRNADITKAPAEKNDIYASGVKAFNAVYPANKLSWDANALLGWGSKQPVKFGKRAGNVCAASSSKSSKSAPATATGSASPKTAASGKPSASSPKASKSAAAATASKTPGVVKPSAGN